MSEIFFWIAGILIFLLGTTYLIKRYTKSETFYILSMVKTDRFNPWFEKLLFLGKWLDWFAKIGLVLGFGAIAVDYLWGRGRHFAVRIALFVFSSFVLYHFFQLVFARFMENPFIGEYSFTLAVVFAIGGFAFFMISSLLAYGIFIITNLLQGEAVCPGVAPLIPGVEIPNVPISVPLHAWLSFLIILVVHEGMHGVLARRAKIKIKSAGLLLAGLLPVGAFVEPDEKQVKKATPKQQLFLFAAGPTANIFLMIFLIIAFNLLLLFVINPFVTPWEQGIYQNSVDSVIVSGVDMNTNVCGRIYDSPAFGKLEEGMLVLKINDTEIKTAEQFYSFRAADPYKSFAITVARETGAPETHEIVPNELGYIGFAVDDKTKEGFVFPQEYSIWKAAYGFFTSFLVWLVLLNFLIAIVNYLPVGIFDGGRMAKIIFPAYLGFLGMTQEQTEKLVGRIFLWIVMGLLILNALPLFL